MMVLLKFIGLFTFSHGGKQNQQGGVALCSGPGWLHFHVPGRILKKSSNTKKNFSRLLKVMVGLLF